MLTRLIQARIIALLCLACFALSAGLHDYLETHSLTFHDFQDEQSSVMHADMEENRGLQKDDSGKTELTACGLPAIELFSGIDPPWDATGASAVVPDGQPEGGAKRHDGFVSLSSGLSPPAVAFVRLAA